MPETLLRASASKAPAGPNAGALVVGSLSHGRKTDERRAAEPSPPQVTVVVPCRPGAGEPAAVRRLGALEYPRSRLEVAVVRGDSPARQRNQAVGRTRGEYILFLDDDSEVSPDLLCRGLRHLRDDPRVAAVGGPAEALPPRTPFSHLAQGVLSEPLVVGRTASRYHARGRLRATDERELILCNLLVRRDAFERVGGFDERLYPNEENELLERFRKAGWRLLYDPEAVVHRPQRESASELLRSVFRYGRGRGAQTRAFPSAVTVGRVVLIGLVIFFGLLFGAILIGSPERALPLLAIPGALLGTVALRRGVPAAAVAVGVWTAYAAGVVVGLVEGPRRRRADRSELRTLILREDLTR